MNKFQGSHLNKWDFFILKTNTMCIKLEGERPWI